MRIYKLLLAVLVISGLFSACSKENTASDIVAAQLVKDEAVINKYLTNNHIKATEVDSAGMGIGVYYVIDSAGVANTVITNSTTVTVSYTGWQINADGTLGASIGSSGTQFQPSFVVGSVISGWQWGLERSGVGNGGAITLYVPSKYAYGPYAQPTLGLPANAVLAFHIVLYNVTND